MVGKTFVKVDRLPVDAVVVTDFAVVVTDVAVVVTDVAVAVTEGVPETVDVVVEDVSDAVPLAVAETSPPLLPPHPAAKATAAPEMRKSRWFIE
jgi:hypothetical protein